MTLTLSPSAARSQARTAKTAPKAWPGDRAAIMCDRRLDRARVLPDLGAFSTGCIDLAWDAGAWDAGACHGPADFERSRAALVEITLAAMRRARRQRRRKGGGVARALETYACAVDQLEASLPFRLRGLAALLHGCVDTLRRAKSHAEAATALATAVQHIGQRLQMLM